ncbi:S41 family peptidase [Lysobacter sp. TY2-98]|uniref:S41 family peptidase n=1 Tax=Lysobacter sp. TY2-98 TaxID=2290922 RepID=UPI0013B3EADF|nr:S41 family peptidase [Lysobacter sp. TY2-98]
MAAIRVVRLFAPLLAIAGLRAYATSPPSTTSASPLASDVATIQQAAASMHPESSFSVDPKRLKSALAAVPARPLAGMSRDEAWLNLSRLNPVLADGHFFVGYPSWRDEAADHLKDGGRLFPFEVMVSNDGAVRVVANLGGAPTPLAGRTIRSINGVSTRTITNELLRHVHGDSARFRSGLLSDRWWFFYWKVYGAPNDFVIGLDGSTRTPTKMAASSAVPAVIAAEQSFERQFALELRSEQSAVLTLNTFAWPNAEQFKTFAASAFEKMERAGTRTLIIDARRNGGGDDALWLEGVLPYIADKPYRWASTYTKRVLRTDPAKGEVAGEVRSGSIDTWSTPDPKQPHRFRGKVYVLIGRTTYSSAVLFANTMHDFGFGTLVGEGQSVRRKQSGGVQKIDLPATGLSLWVPRFILTPPAGDKGYWLTPDVEISDDGINPGAMVEAVLKRASADQASGAASPLR